MKILLVEDASASMILLTKMIKGVLPGVEIHGANNGKSAVLMLSSGINFDLIILDLGLPDISGLDIINIAGSMNIKTPIVSISDESNQSALNESVELGAKEYITKPIVRRHLINVLKTHLNLDTLDHSKNILVVDDEEINRFLMRKILEPLGYNIIEAENGFQACRAAQNNNLEAVFMDIRMPYMDGREASKLLKRDNPYLPIIAITGELPGAGDDSLFDQVIRKPITTSLIPESLNACIKGKKKLWEEELDVSHAEHQENNEPEEKAEFLEDFYKFIPRAFLQSNNADALKRGLKDVRVCNILFIDIRHFTEMSSRLSAEECFHFLNSYFEFIEPLVNSFGGLVYQFLGDGVVCTFPMYKEKYSNNVVHAAISIQDRLKIYNRGRVRAGYQPIEVGCSISTGPTAMGICGSKNRFEVGAFGNTVNIAARTQEICSEFELGIVITSEVIAHLDDSKCFLLRPLGKHVLKGVQEPLMLFEVFNQDEPDTRASKEKSLECIPSPLDPLTRHKVEEISKIMPEEELWQKLLSTRSFQD